MENDVGKLLRKKRKEKKLTLDDIAKFVGVGKSTVSKWERGFIKNMKRDKVNSLSTILDIDPLVFIYGTSEDIEMEQISPLEFKTEVLNLLQKTTNLSDKEKEMLITNIEFICNENN